MVRAQEPPPELARAAVRADLVPAPETQAAPSQARAGGQAQPAQRSAGSHAQSAAQPGAGDRRQAASPCRARGRAADSVRSQRPGDDARERARRSPVARAAQPPQRLEYPGLAQGERHNHGELRKHERRSGAQIGDQAGRPGREDGRNDPLPLHKGRNRRGRRDHQTREDHDEGLPAQLRSIRRAACR